MILTISRQAASRGEQVARRAADRLNAPLIDPEVVSRAALRIGLVREELADPERARRLGERLAQVALDLASDSGDDPDWALAPLPALTDAGYRLVVESMIRRLAEDSSFVMAGYPAQAVLSGPGSAVHALVVAPLVTRVQRLIMREDFTPRMAERVLRESDRDRLEFYRRHYNLQWDDPANYDCVLNTARLDLDQAAAAIVAAAEGRYGRSPATA